MKKTERAERTELKKFRGGKLLTQTQIAKMLGYNRAHYARFENGTAEITLRFLEALTKAFGLTLEEAKAITKRDNE